jgi:hypothetical protein
VELTSTLVNVICSDMFMIEPYICCEIIVRLDPSSFHICKLPTGACRV